jgi:ERCC4-related helicase
LSATPGKNLENIAEVVKSLRISKIEARLDSDPEVQKYVHNKELETIVVEPSSEISAVNVLLGKLLNPLLEDLRKRNGIRNFRGSNSTITSYNVLMSMRECIHGGDHYLTPKFTIVQALLRVREGLRENGIGFARSRLRTILSDHSKKNGPGQKVVTSDAFMTLFNAVVSTQDVGGPNPTSDQLKMNNPKLSKLEAILNEHFQRSRATGESSRAIVFSQWRDSVEEIVNVLKASMPLVRPKQFVGQGSGSYVAADGSSPKKVSGMNQKEQQRVIREFRDDKYNVLVCTW